MAPVVVMDWYSNMQELLLGISNYFAYYNSERPHQAIGYKTPKVVYETAQGGGALIVDKYGKEGTGQRRYCQVNRSYAVLAR